MIDTSVELQVIPALLPCLISCMMQAFKGECCQKEVLDTLIEVCRFLHYLDEALGEFSAGLTGGCLDSDHR